MPIMDNSTFGILYFIFVVSSIYFWHGHQFRKLFHKNDTTTTTTSPVQDDTLLHDLPPSLADVAGAKGYRLEDISANFSPLTCEKLIHGRKCSTSAQSTLSCDTNCYLKVHDCIIKDGKPETKLCCCKDPNEIIDRSNVKPPSLDSD